MILRLVLAVVLGRQALDQRAEARDRSAALAAARQIAVNFSTLDYRTFDRDTARVAAVATGTFKGTTDFDPTDAGTSNLVTTNANGAAFAWRLADQLGWASTYDAEYVALTKLQGDAFVTVDEELARQVEGVVPTATIEALEAS